MCTIIGSSNFSGRSVNLDLELSFLLITTSKSLKDKLRGEIQSLNLNSDFVNNMTFNDKSRKVKNLTKILLNLGVDGML